MVQEIRNRLRSVVTQSRRLLEDAISQELEGKYGIFARKETVTADPHAKMPHLSLEEQEARKDILDHYAHIQARGFKPKEALDQLVREVAFTHLNRLCAYKMMEAREVYVGGQKFRESVSRGVNSNGVKFYLAEHEEDERLFNTGQQDIAYRHYLDWLGGQLSGEIGVLFNPNDPANRLYPRQKTLDEVLDLLNNGGIKSEEVELRVQWPQIWSQDETIGWVYQYFTPKELRDQARKESQAPRNSYELAFRNQFFTPRYVVEFLTDNTLGRIWYEMRKGGTKLKDQCQYMVRRPNEIFLKEGEQTPKDAAEGKDDLSQEELLKVSVHIPHRPKKDPREIKILDPACGSGHFLLYCFDLLLTIYEEAYADPNLGPALKKDYPTLDALKRDIPHLILAKNLHGIDIDLRASQIAALALWLRCQRAYQEMGLKKDRPQIIRSNFVCAEPMPGEEQMLKDFVNQLEPKVLGQVVEVVFGKMKLAGEAGSLLKIEEEIRDTVAAAKKQYVRETTQARDRKGQPLLFTQPEMDRLDRKPEQLLLFDFSDITDSQFFEQAEKKVIEALRSYAEKAQNDQQLQRRLFSEDAMRGFAFVDLSQKRYDVVLMNPPFGECAQHAVSYVDMNFKHWCKNLASAFFMRMLGLLTESGFVGAVYDRSLAIKQSYERFREEVLLRESFIQTQADLGWEVLEASVEVSAIISSRSEQKSPNLFFDVESVKPNQKQELLLQSIIDTRTSKIDNNSFYCSPKDFAFLPNHVLSFQFPQFLRYLFVKYPPLSEQGFDAYEGHTFKADRHLRLIWELPESEPVRFNHSKWSWLYHGNERSLYYNYNRDVAQYGTNGDGIAEHQSVILRNLPKQGRPGIGWGKRGVFLDAQLIRPDHVCSVEGKIANVADKNDRVYLSALISSNVFQFGINYYCGQHKTSGYVKIFPSPLPDPNDRAIIEANVTEIYRRKLVWQQGDETDIPFVSPHVLRMRRPSFSSSIDNVLNWETSIEAEVKAMSDEIELAFERIYNLPASMRDMVRVTGRKRPESRVWADVGNDERSKRRWLADAVLSYFIGCAFERWDITAIDEGYPDNCDLALDAPVPRHSCGSIIVRCPDAATGKAFIVDDPSCNRTDIVEIIHWYFEHVWGVFAENIKKEVINILEVDNIREYFQRTSKGGFWDAHLSRYTSTRRGAPIYWLLQSSKKNYAIWLYYHRFDKDSLFKALVNYVEPKIRLETSRLESFRTQKAGTGDSGKEAKRLAKEVEKQEDFLSELQDFEDKLRRAANLHLEPDLNDGVVLNIAPLWELVPWKEAKNHWDELLDGQYEWSSIGKQLRQKGLVK
jgi:hypothetical protein